MGKSSRGLSSGFWMLILTFAMLSMGCVAVFMLHPGYDPARAWADRPEAPYMAYARWFFAGGLFSLAGGAGLLGGLGLSAIRRIRPDALARIALIGNLCAACSFAWAYVFFGLVAGQ